MSQGRRRGLPRLAALAPAEPLRGFLPPAFPPAFPPDLPAALPAAGFCRALPVSARLSFGWGAVLGRPRVLLTVRPRTMPMNSSTRSVVSSSSHDSATRDSGRPAPAGT